MSVRRKTEGPATSINRVELTEGVLKHALWFADRVTYAQARFGVGACARVNEIEQLQWGDLDLDRGRARLVGCNRGATSGRVVVLPRDVLSTLRAMKSLSLVDGQACVWAEGRGTAKVPLRVRWRRLFSQWEKAYAAGRVDMAPLAIAPTAHQLRRHGIQLMIDRGVPHADVAAFAGLIRWNTIKGTRH